MYIYMYMYEYQEAKCDTPIHLGRSLSEVAQ